MIVDSTAAVRAGVAWRRANDGTGRVEDREGVRRVVLVQLLEDHLFGDLDLLRLAADDAESVRVGHACVFFVDVNVSTRCFLNDLDVLALLADNHSDGVERDKNVVLNSLLTLLDELTLVVAAVPRRLALRAGRVPDADCRLVACFSVIVVVPVVVLFHRTEVTVAGVACSDCLVIILSRASRHLLASLLWQSRLLR